MRRFDPGYVRAKELIDAGELGRIEQFRAYSRDTYPASIEFLRHSGGSFLDMSVHDFDLARFLVGEVEEVHAWGSVVFDERFAEVGDVDTAVTMLRFQNGALGVVEMSRHSEWGYDIRTEVAGALGQGRRRGPPEDAGAPLATVRLRGRPLRELPRSVRGRVPGRARDVLPDAGRGRHADARARGGARDAPARDRRDPELARGPAGPGGGRHGRGVGVTARAGPSRPLGRRPGHAARDHAGERRLAVPVIPRRRPRTGRGRRRRHRRVRGRDRPARRLRVDSGSTARPMPCRGGMSSPRSRMSPTSRRRPAYRIEAGRRPSRSRSGRRRRRVAIRPGCTRRTSCRASSAAARTWSEG